MKIKYKIDADGIRSITPCPFSRSMSNNGEEYIIQVGSTYCTSFCMAVNNDTSKQILDCRYNKQ
jgi:hypothetical protein